MKSTVKSSCLIVALAFAPLFAARAADPSAPDASVPVKPKARELKDVKLLYFHAAWCQGCKRFEAGRVLERLLQKEPALALEKVDVDQHQDLLEKYGVEYTPTLLLVDADGFKLGKVKIALDDADATLERAHKLVKKATGR